VTREKSGEGVNDERRDREESMGGKKKSSGFSSEIV
jgi:hypothetical protein